ncbi:MAG: hypothetical protein PW789_09245 [Edaphobacter sp.]|uniref:hypothetical protein n=1 Tax=Edaphobacter sp. TaxID=1934404 RepID=UPI002388FBF4|nr:hypothetical protein [Edaphobacter sp.]MDE1176780.1 hypothetical protein [Edaphobacter sp.]
MSYSRTERIRQELLATYKWLLSLFKPSDRWQLVDYPVITIHKDNSDFKGPSRLKPVEWSARIVRWHISGSGDTEQEAIEKLRSALESKREKDKVLPRPGTKVPIEFASQQLISNFKHLEADFVYRILRIEWAWMSDESSLWDFHSEENNDEYYRRIQDVYGVDVSDIQGAKIARILEKISNFQH